jgi:hypothetical protein
MSPMSKIPRLAICFAATGVLALAGCGSSKSSGLSKTDLANKADAVCSSYTKAASAISQPKDFFTNPVAAAAYLDKLKPLVATQEHAMQALKPDSSVKPLWDQFLAAGEHTTVLFNRADAKAHAKDRTGIGDLVRAASSKQRTVNPLARQLGASACAR